MQKVHLEPLSLTHHPQFLSFQELLLMSHISRLGLQLRTFEDVRNEESAIELLSPFAYQLNQEPFSEK